MQYAMLKIEASGVQAMNAWGVYGAPPPSAYQGFIEALLRSVVHDLGVDQGPIFDLHKAVVPDFLVTVHHYSPRGHFDRHTGRQSFHLPISSHIQTSANEKHESQSMMDRPRVDMGFTLLFPVPSEAVTEGVVRDALFGASFAGGVIDESWVRVEDFGTWGPAARALSSWVRDLCWVMREHDFRSAIDPEDEDAPQGPIEALIHSMSERGQWVAPSLLGYRLLHEPCSQPTQRKEADVHAYADPLIGAVRYEPLARLLKDDHPLVPTWSRGEWASGDRVIEWRETLCH